jgi:hypothetical protein
MHHLNLLLILTTQDSQRAIGVSKRCCPMCASLLSQLNKDRKMMFVITDVHPLYTGCDISKFLPEDVVLNLVRESCSILRAEIKKLRSNQKRDRADTSGTGRMSIDSVSSLVSTRSNEADDSRVFGRTDPESAV